MKNILYENVVRRAQDIPIDVPQDGETDDRVIVTEENNCFIIWKTTYSKDEVVYVELYSKYLAIEKGVLLAKEIRDGYTKHHTV